MGQAASSVLSIGSDIAQYGTTANAQNTATNVMNQGYTNSIQGMIGQQQQAQQAWNPYQQMGTSALQQLQSPGGIQATPGFDFAAQSGMNAMMQKLNASGQNFSPQTIQALTAYGQNIGQQGYQQSFNNLMSEVGVGQQATGMNTGQQQNMQNMLSQLYQGQSGMQAASAMAGAANQNQLIGGIQGSLQGMMGGSGNPFSSMSGGKGGGAGGSSGAGGLQGSMGSISNSIGGLTSSIGAF